jgi:diaminopimelate epimerase
MHGLGNDFVVLDARQHPISLARPQLARIADRRFGIGCDQLILLEPSVRADARMRIFNPDGGEVQACGNATRCIGHLLAEEKQSAWATIETAAGLLKAERTGAHIAVDMGLPVLEWGSIPLSGAAASTERVPIASASIDPGLPGWFSAVNMGNPHAVFFVPNADRINLDYVGPRLEHHPLFPERANISFASPQASGSIRLRVWERAAGATLACGTAACATAVAAERLGYAKGDIRIDLPGGPLLIRRNPLGHVIMIGPVAQSFTGIIDPSLLSEPE